MIHDQSKNTDIRYNNLNLPESVKFISNTQNGHIYYHYDVMGNKIAQTKEEGNKDIIKTEYLGNFIYKNGVLITILTEEGRIVPTGDTYSYEYNIKDHLGNTRATFAGTSFGADLIQTTSYYPFGLVMEQENFNTPTANYEKNQYLYNGKELQDEGFGGVSLGWLDYGARMYNPVLGRFHTQDRFAEKYYSLNPYQYAANNPIRFIDVNGDSISVNTEEMYRKEDGEYVNYDQALAFEAFLMTPEGQKYIRDNAQAGFAFKGQITGLKINVKDAGKYSETVNVAFQVGGTSGNRGLTDFSISDGKLDLTISVAGTALLSDLNSHTNINSGLQAFNTWQHETLLHAEFITKKFNVGMSEQTIKDRYGTQHSNEVFKQSTYYRVGQSLNKWYNKQINAGHTDNFIWYNIINAGLNSYYRDSIQK